MVVVLPKFLDLDFKLLVAGWDVDVHWDLILIITMSTCSGWVGGVYVHVHLKLIFDRIGRAEKLLGRTDRY